MQATALLIASKGNLLEAILYHLYLLIETAEGVFNILQYLLVYELKDSRLITHFDIDWLHMLADLSVLAFSKKNIDRTRKGCKGKKKNREKKKQPDNTNYDCITERGFVK